uniref:Uncharacterized protein n=1 Tax=Anguilla anguilla TaxID=7936 RepID=A0A0E9WMZ9_ANGAN
MPVVHYTLARATMDQVLCSDSSRSLSSTGSLTFTMVMIHNLCSVNHMSVYYLCVCRLLLD